MLNRMPALQRVWLRRLRSFPDALLEVPALRGVDLSQELANPVFHIPPEPGPLLADVARLKAVRPGIRAAFGDDSCFEPPLFARVVDEIRRIAADCAGQRLTEGAAALSDLLPEVPDNLDVLSHVMLYDIRSLSVYAHRTPASLASGTRRDEHEARRDKPAEEALAGLGPPAGWFPASLSRSACRQLARQAGNTVGWALRHTDPHRPVAAAETAIETHDERIVFPPPLPARRRHGRNPRGRAPRQRSRAPQQHQRDGRLIGYTTRRDWTLRPRAAVPCACSVDANFVAHSAVTAMLYKRARRKPDVSAPSRAGVAGAVGDPGTW